MDGSEAIVDSNLVIAFLRNDPAAFAKIEALTRVLLPYVVLGELYHGAFNSAKPQENIRHVNRFAERCLMLDFTTNTALTYGRLKTQLRQKGRPIPENDLWIAVHAVNLDVPLLSRDKHFEVVDELRYHQW